MSFLSGNLFARGTSLGSDFTVTELSARMGPLRGVVSLAVFALVLSGVMAGFSQVFTKSP